MLIDLNEIVNKRNILSGKHRAVVVDNFDPLNMGRIRVTAENILNGTPEQLPYFYPYYSAFRGVGNGAVAMAVPQIGTMVDVEFLYDSIYHGIYTGVIIGDKSLNSNFNNPNTYGFKDEIGNGMVVSLFENTMTLSHSSGSSILFDNEGNIKIRANNKVLYESDSETMMTIDSNNNTYDVGFKDLYQILANNYFVTANTIKEEIKSIESNISGNKTQTIQGSLSKSIGSNMSMSVLGSSDVSVIGDSYSKIAGKFESVVGQGEDKKVLSGDISTTLTQGNTVLEMLMGSVTSNLTQGDFSVNIKSGNFNLTTKLGNIQISTSNGNVEINGTKINLGSGSEPILLGQKTTNWLSTHTHGGPTGITDIPVQASQVMNLLSKKVFTE